MRGFDWPQNGLFQLSCPQRRRDEYCTFRRCTIVPSWKAAFPLLQMTEAEPSLFRTTNTSSLIIAPCELDASKASQVGLVVYVELSASAAATNAHDHPNAGAADPSNVARGAHVHRRSRCRQEQLKRSPHTTTRSDSAVNGSELADEAFSGRDLRQDLTRWSLPRP
jgi:hypothetical protein